MIKTMTLELSSGRVSVSPFSPEGGSGEDTFSVLLEEFSSWEKTIELKLTTAELEEVISVFSWALVETEPVGDV